MYCSRLTTRWIDWTGVLFLFLLKPVVYSLPHSVQEREGNENIPWCIGLYGPPILSVYCDRSLPSLVIVYHYSTLCLDSYYCTSHDQIVFTSLCIAYLLIMCISACRQFIVWWYCASCMGTKPLYIEEEVKAPFQADQPNGEYERCAGDIVWDILTRTRVPHLFWIVFCTFILLAKVFYRGHVIKLLCYLLLNFNNSNEWCACSEMFKLYHLFIMKLPQCFIVNWINVYTSLQTSVL